MPSQQLGATGGWLAPFCSRSPASLPNPLQITAQKLFSGLSGIRIVAPADAAKKRNVWCLSEILMGVPLRQQPQIHPLTTFNDILKMAAEQDKSCLSVSMNKSACNAVSCIPPDTKLPARLPKFDTTERKAAHQAGELLRQQPVVYK